MNEIQEGLVDIQQGVGELGGVVVEEVSRGVDVLLLLLQIFYEFAMVGMFSVGGGLATIPFLQSLGTRTGWFTQGELTNMIAVSESTPGPMGINMASYVGFETFGLIGAMVATLGIITPSIIIIILIARVLEKFKNSPVVRGIFYGIRPASAALILAAALQVAEVGLTQETELGYVLFPNAVALSLVLWGLMYYSPAKKCHPVVFVAFSGIMGVLFQF